MAASLGAMVAGLASKKGVGGAPELGEQLGEAREFFEKAAERDAAAYDAVRAAYRLPKDQRGPAVEAALQGAAVVPLEVFERATALAPLLHRLREIAPPALHSDLETAAALLDAARRGARANVETNLDGSQDEAFRNAARRKL